MLTETTILAWTGTTGLAFAVCTALLGAMLHGRVALREGAERPARWVTLLPAAGALCSVAALEWGLLTHDFGLRFVAENGSRETPAYYTFTSLWAAHDGSLLLWLLILTGYLAVVGRRRTPPVRLHAAATAVLALVTVFFGGLAASGDVFHTVVPIPRDGPGPNPLLRSDPAMGIHPPLLYAGLLGMAVPFSYAVAAMVLGRTGSTWLAVVRRATLVAWTALTAGIVLGAWWSYAVLGWGGYWSWDPVENTSLMPWLVATALLHSLMAHRGAVRLPAWPLALAISTFLLSCLGAFLTRSDVVASLHSFATSAVGPILLGFLAALLAGLVVLAWLRRDDLDGLPPIRAATSRRAALLANNVLLLAITITVLVGTVFPLAVSALHGAQLSVGPPYYDRVVLPMAAAVLLLMAVGPLIGVRRGLGREALVGVGLPWLLGCAVVIAVAETAPASALALAAFGIATFVVSTSVVEAVRTLRAQPVAAANPTRPRTRRIAALIVHAGLAIAAVGITASGAYASSAERHLTPGHMESVDGVGLRLGPLATSSSGGATTTRAHLVVLHDGSRTDLAPGLSYYPAQQTTVAEPAIHSRPGGDLYLTLLAAGRHGVTVRLAENPLISLLWAGGGVMAGGGLLALWPTRVRRRTPETSAVPMPAAEEELVQ